MGSTQPDIAKLLADLKKQQKENEDLKKTSLLYAVPAVIFPRFSELPAELRAMIWKRVSKSVGPRMIGLIVHSNRLYDPHYSCPANRQPGFLFTCKESRAEALKQFTLYPEKVGRIHRFFDHDLDTIYIKLETYEGMFFYTPGDTETIDEPLASRAGFDPRQLKSLAIDSFIWDVFKENLLEELYALPCVGATEQGPGEDMDKRNEEGDFDCSIMSEEYQYDVIKLFEKDLVANAPNPWAENGRAAPRVVMMRSISKKNHKFDIMLS